MLGARWVVKNIINLQSFTLEKYINMNNKLNRFFPKLVLTVSLADFLTVMIYF